MRGLKNWLAVGLLATTAFTVPASAADKFFVYVSPDQIGVNAFLKLGQSGIEQAGEQYGAEVETYESRTAADRLDFLGLHTGKHHELKVDRQEIFPYDMKLRAREKVVDIGHPTSNRVLDRDHRQIGSAGFDSGEAVFKGRTGKRLHVGKHIAAGGV